MSKTHICIPNNIPTLRIEGDTNVDWYVGCHREVTVMAQTGNSPATGFKPVFHNEGVRDEDDRITGGMDLPDQHIDRD